MVKKNNVKLYQPDNSSEKVPKRAMTKNSKKNSYHVNAGMTNQFFIQQDLHTIGIYDHEWKALHDCVEKIESDSSKFNIGPILDGFGIAICFPLAINFYKIIDLKANVPSDIISECKIYGFLMVLYIVSLTTRKIFKPKWLTSYTRFDSDIKNLNNRMDEIEERIGNRVG